MSSKIPKEVLISIPLGTPEEQREFIKFLRNYKSCISIIVSK